MKRRMLSWSVCMLVSGAVGARAQVAVESLAAPAAETAAASAEDMGYALGFQIGQQILADQKQMGSPVDSRMLAAGIADAISAAKPRLDEARFRAAMASLEAVMRRKQQDMVEKMRAVAAANLTKGSDYLKKKAAEPGVKALPSGLLYEVLHEGTGAQPTLDHVVVARYVGRHIDGTQFDGTDPSGPPAEFPLRGVVPGWQEALPLMKAGSKWRIHLPPALGYGDEGSPPAITPNEVLVFEIELLESRAGNTAK